MVRCINKVKEIDVAAVAGNKTLAAAVDRRAVERCKDVIEKLGVVHTPVVCAAKDGSRLLLSGQSGLTALRELGVRKMDAIEVEAADDGGNMAKLSLLLLSLQDRPGALCEGLLLQEAVNDGVPRLEIQAMLGKSASWVSNRLSLVTRLDGNVYEMVRGGLLEPRSAQEVARLPSHAQFAFAERAVREGLPKSAIESLVASYNDADCPDAVKAQILSDPRTALGRMADKRRAIKAGGHKSSAPPDGIDGCVKSAKTHMAMLSRALFSLSPNEAAGRTGALKELEVGLLALLTMIRGLFSPGKTEGAHCDGQMG
jgi:ParB-like chromosome segregation protein Spo0J